eukprot:scaffold24589_cov166-Skeletonema_marinoi.AAC.2
MSCGGEAVLFVHLSRGCYSSRAKLCSWSATLGLSGRRLERDEDMVRRLRGERFGAQVGPLVETYECNSDALCVLQ